MFSDVTSASLSLSATLISRAAGGEAFAPRDRRARLVHGAHVGMVLLQLCLTVGTFSAPNFERVVVGSLPMALKARGFDFTDWPSMVDLASLAARGGGLNLLMSGCFWMFNIVSPCLRAISLLALLLLPLTLERARSLFRLSKMLIAFYALDVMLIATPLINQERAALSARAEKRHVSRPPAPRAPPASRPRLTPLSRVASGVRPHLGDPARSDHFPAVRPAQRAVQHRHLPAHQRRGQAGLLAQRRHDRMHGLLGVRRLADPQVYSPPPLPRRRAPATDVVQRGLRTAAGAIAIADRFAASCAARAPGSGPTA